jgi:hypothetical protein
VQRTWGGYLLDVFEEQSASATGIEKAKGEEEGMMPERWLETIPCRVSQP